MTWNGIRHSSEKEKKGREEAVKRKRRVGGIGKDVYENWQCRWWKEKWNNKKRKKINECWNAKWIKMEGVSCYRKKLPFLIQTSKPGLQSQSEGGLYPLLITNALLHPLSGGRHISAKQVIFTFLGYHTLNFMHPILCA